MALAVWAAMSKPSDVVRRIAMVALAVFAACAPIHEDGNVDTSVMELSGSSRRPRV